MTRLTIVLLLVALAISCTDINNNDRRLNGRCREILVVMDKPFSDGKCAEVLLSLLKQKYPQLPQEEPMFDVTLIPSSSFNSYMKSYRSILLCEIGGNGGMEDGIRTGRNLWTNDQIFMKISASGADAFINLAENNNKTITDFFSVGEQKRLTDYYRIFKDSIISDIIFNKFGFAMAVPKGFKYHCDNNGFAHISNHTVHNSQDIIIYTISRDISSGNNTEEFLALHDSVIKKNISGSSPGSWMTTEKEVKVSSDSTVISGRTIKEIRGLWRTENDFMGGPFIINYVYLPEKNHTIVTMGYVYAPRTNKRDFLVQTEAILYSAIY